MEELLERCEGTGVQKSLTLMTLKVVGLEGLGYERKKKVWAAERSWEQKQAFLR